MTILRDAFVTGMLLFVACAAAAQPLGTFRWQLQPFCNVITVTVTQVGGVYRLEGTDHECVSEVSASVIGTAFLNPDGSIGLGFNVVSAPGGEPHPVSATLTLPSLSGTWRDSAGHSGAFAYTPGSGTGGAPRPLPETHIGDITRVSAGPGLEGGGQWGEVTIGLPTTATGAYRFENEVGLVALGGFPGAPPPISGPGSRMLYYAGRNAFRVGRVNGTQWDAANIGELSVAMGFNTTASGSASLAVGNYSVAADTASVALGNGVLAGGAAAVAMGEQTSAAGTSSVTLGYHAIALPAAAGSFVFADRSSSDNFTSYAPNEFLVRAASGVGFYTNRLLTTGLYLAPSGSQWLGVSDVHTKHRFRDLDGEDVLARLARMPVTEWSYKAQDEAIRHIGPTAQDFHAAFGLGEDPLRIGTMDADGVALAGVQALEARTRALQDENASLRAALVALTRRLDDLARALADSGVLGLPRP